MGSPSGGASVRGAVTGGPVGNRFSAASSARAWRMSWLLDSCWSCVRSPAWVRDS